MQKTLGYPLVIMRAVLASMGLVAWCQTQHVPNPLVFDTEQHGAASQLGKHWRVKVHREPSLTAPLVRLPTTSSKYRYDLMRAITRKPGIVLVLRELEIGGLDSKSQPVRVHLKKGEQFESSDSAMLLMHDGSDCVARIHGITLYPNCVWLSGFNPQLREGKFKFVHPSGETEVWYRIVDPNGKIIGWRLQDWQFQED